MSIFASLFGSSTSDAAQKSRQDALNAFNAVKTPELSALQVQLNDYVNAGKMTPEQAESSLLSSNAFNSIVTDPANNAAQKQALLQLQQIGTQGGLTAIDKAQLNDITAAQNQQNQSQNAATMQQAQQRGVGGSDLTAINQLINEQGAADRAANSGTQVAANAQQRALQAMQGAGQLGTQMESQQYGEQANKAQSQNAIDLFNKQALNQTNLYNTQTANAAQAANLANAQAINNANTATQNSNKEYNAGQNQTVFQDQLSKAQGIAGVNQNAANSEQAQKNMETGFDTGLISKAVQGGATALGGAMGGPAGAMAASSATPSGKGPSYESELPGGGGYNPNAPTNEDMFYSGGEVTDPKLTPQEINDLKLFILKQQAGVSNNQQGLQPDLPNQSKSLSPQDLANMQNGQPSATQLRGTQNLQSPPTNTQPGYTQGGEVTDPEHPNHMANGGHVHCYSYGGEAYHHPECSMNKGGFLSGLKKGALHRDLGVPQDKNIPAKKIEKATHSNDETLRKRAQFAENAKHWNHKADGGEVETSTDTAHPAMDKKEEGKNLLARLGELLGSHGEIANKIDTEYQGGQIDYRKGGSVPGKAPVKGDSPKNDIVDAKLSPGEVVIPRSAMNDEDEFHNFMTKFDPAKKKMAVGGIVPPTIPRVNDMNPMRNTAREPMNSVPLAATNDANDFKQMMTKMKPPKKQPKPMHVPLEAQALANLHQRLSKIEGGQ